MIYPDGGRYQGAFSSGQPGGEGEYLSPDGERYRGRFLAGFPDGEVEVTFADGRTETQVWANGERSEP